jgi:Bax protein
MEKSKQKPIILGGVIALAILIIFVLANREDPSLPTVQASFSDKIRKLPDFSEIKDVTEKKNSFFETLYPAIEQENKQILKVRDAIANLQAVPFESLAENQLSWISDTSKYFRIKDEEVTEETLAKLMQRVDIVPPSLALTQAAIESGWGSSRFSREGNNIFGQWCFTKGCGMVPSSRDSDKAHEVSEFSSINAAVRSYIRNLNSGNAYQKLRAERAKLRNADKEITGIALAKTLDKYSEEGEVYIAKLTKFINQNKLQRFNQQFQESLVQQASL